jgi:adenine phosphoribosyltransferase
MARPARQWPARFIELPVSSRRGFAKVRRKGWTMDLKQHIRGVPDFPRKGILFYDISTLLAHAEAWKATVEHLTEALRPHKPDLLVGIESRGFLVSAPIAYCLGCGFVMVRKKGKLPGQIIPHTYDLEYGTDTI